MERICGEKMKTTDYDMINEFAFRHFPSNTVSQNGQGEGLGGEREKNAQPDSEKKNVITFYLHQSFLCFSQTELLGGAW